MFNSSNNSTDNDGNNSINNNNNSNNKKNNNNAIMYSLICIVITEINSLLTNLASFFSPFLSFLFFFQSPKRGAVKMPQMRDLARDRANSIQSLRLNARQIPSSPQAPSRALGTSPLAVRSSPLVLRSPLAATAVSGEAVPEISPFVGTAHDVVLKVSGLLIEIDDQSIRFFNSLYC